jgi:hypothetical protein
MPIPLPPLVKIIPDEPEELGESRNRRWFIRPVRLEFAYVELAELFAAGQEVGTGGGSIKLAEGTRAEHDGDGIVTVYGDYTFTWPASSPSDSTPD